MCGILGIVGRPRSESLDAVELLRHRGPDGEGRWLGPNAGPRDAATRDHRSRDRGPAGVERARRRRRRRQRRALQLPRASLRPRGEGPHVPRCRRRRARAAPLRGARRALRRAPARDVRDRALGRVEGTPPARPRSLRDQAALPRRRWGRPRVLVGARAAARARRVVRARPRGDRGLPRARLRPRNPDGNRRRAEARSRCAARAREREHARGAVVAPGAARAPARGDARGGGAPAPALGRPARGAALRRPRLVADRIARSAGARPAAAHVHRRVRRRRLRRARAGARDRPRDRLAARGADGRDRRRGGSADDRRAARAAVRGPRRDPALVPLPRRRGRGEGRARRRRRRRGLRRLLALRVGPGRRPPGRARPARAAAPGARRPQERRASRVEAARSTRRSPKRPAICRGSR